MDVDSFLEAVRPVRVHVLPGGVWLVDVDARVRHEDVLLAVGAQHVEGVLEHGHVDAWLVDGAALPSAEQALLDVPEGCAVPLRSVDAADARGAAWDAGGWSQAQLPAASASSRCLISFQKLILIETIEHILKICWKIRFEVRNDLNQSNQLKEDDESGGYALVPSAARDVALASAALGALVAWTGSAAPPDLPPGLRARSAPW